jgi:hypothetical protein
VGPKPRSITDNLIRSLRIGNGCWEWAGPLDKNGYGVINQGQRRIFAHRVVYEINFGPIPQGLEPDHLCRNRRCVRPDHLYLARPSTKF